MDRRKCIGLWLCIILTVTSYGQSLTKYEKEYRVQPDKVPAQAVAFMTALIPDQKVKWFEEEGLERISFEAKFKAFKHRYSVEFDKEGVLEDIEVVIKSQEVPSQTMSTMKAELDQQFDGYTWRRIQRQYSGPAEVMPTMVAYTYEVPDEVAVKYEIVFCGKSSAGKKLYEALFDEKGHLQQLSTIVLRDTDNLEF